MADWYMQGDTPDQSRLPRILDVAQDPKVKAVCYTFNCCVVHETLNVERDRVKARLGLG